MPVTVLTADNFDATINNPDKKPVFVDFYADWCGPCKLAAPIVEKLSDEYADRVIIGQLDTDDNSEVAGKFGVMSIPTVLIFKEGQEVDRKIGFPGEAVYRQMLEKVAMPAPQASTAAPASRTEPAPTKTPGEAEPQVPPVVAES